MKKILKSWFNDLNQPLLLDQGDEPVCPSMNEVGTVQFSSGGRDEIFDVLKGIAIFFMILGHCEVYPLYPFIYSFHMPLFFFVAGYFLKIRPFRDELRLNVRRLIVPYFFSAICISVIAVCVDLSNYAWADGSFSQGFIIKLLLGYNGVVAPEWLKGDIGACWFILAMFFARCITVSLVSKIKSVKILCFIIFFLGILGIFLERFFFVPYCIPQGLSAVGFIYVGFLVKKYRLLEVDRIKKIIPFFLLLWLYCWIQKGTISMVHCRFPTGYVFSLFGALGAFFTLYVVVKNLYRKESLFWKIIHWGGRYSLVIYCIHCIEVNLSNWRGFAVLHHIPLEHYPFFQILMRMIIAVGFALIVLKIKPLKEHVFQIRDV
ncbi:acyltransferase family protein [Fibrobacter sp.]